MWSYMAIAVVSASIWLAGFSFVIRPNVKYIGAFYEGNPSRISFGMRPNAIIIGAHF